jgi:predicted Zn-dependent protease
MPDAETAPAAPLLALARFARRDEILKQPAPPEAMRYVTGTWRYARGLAYVATGRRAGAEQELATLREVQRGVPADPTVASFFTTADMLALAAESLAGEIAVRTGDPGATVGHLAEAVRLQDRHWFTEPPPWYYPVRQSLGFALPQADRAAEAEAVYREDLRRNPENGWSLFGLARSLRAQGPSADAAAVEARFRLAWARADVTLTSSRL